jgi:diguanylate cyclase (GGDEF)-like protein/PAS domain S-box-containing protein
MAPDNEPASGPGSPGGEEDDRTRELARNWVKAVAATTYVPMSAYELEDFLHDLVRTLADALAARPFSERPGAEVGARMVTGQLVGFDSLQRSVALLVNGLLDLDGPLDEPGAGRVRDLAALLGAMSAGYADAMRRRTLEQQEDMKRALLAAKQRAERVMRATEHLFQEVFTSSPTGVAITDLAGRVIRANPALAEILACEPEDLVGESIVDYVADDDPGLRFRRSRGRRKLVRRDGETAWVYVARSPLRSGSGEPDVYVTTVQDLSELQLLQGRFGHQLLHDALTGVANRLYFESTLETRLGQAGSDASITLCCLNLDAMSVLNDGLGHRIGDYLLRTVAKRLEAAVADEPAAFVARIGGDEFAVLIEDSSTTPDIPELVARLNAALAEPEYVDGSGIAVSAAIGVVRCTASEMPAAELFRAAEAALHNARATGRGQWMQFDPEQDLVARQGYRDAAALPGAYEQGELEVTYEPVVRLVDRQIVAYHAGLHWPGRADGPLDERATMALAERTGQSILFGPWLMRHACENAPVVDAEHPEPVLRIRLSRLQTADDNLVAAVNHAVAVISPHLLEIAFDTGAVRDELGSAPDNLQVVSEIGVVAGLAEFHGGPRELGLLARCPVRSVILADPFGGSEDNRPPALSPVTRSIEQLVAAITEIGARTSVDGVRTEEQAAWWASIGVSTARGPLFEPAVLEEVVSGNGHADL